MTTTLEKARQAIDDLRKSGEAPAEVAKLEADFVKAQMVEISKGMGKLSDEVSSLRKEKEAMPSEKGDADLAGVKKDERGTALSSVTKSEDATEAAMPYVLDLALEEIINLRAQNSELQKFIAIAKAEDKKEDFPPAEIVGKDEGDEDKDKDDKKDKDEKKDDEVEKMEDGPTAKLKRPASDDYSATKEGQNLSKAEFYNVLKALGYQASSTPQPAAINRGGIEVGAGTGQMDLEKAVESFAKLPFKVQNQFRVQVDPEFARLNQRMYAIGGLR